MMRRFTVGKNYTISFNVDKNLIEGFSNFSQDFNSDSYPECPGPLDIDEFSAHGLALKEIEKSYFDLYITSHGAREAIEMFTLDLRDIRAKLVWKGCVPLDETIMHNSLAILSDGGFITTQFITWAGGVESAFSGEAKGSLVTWSPGGEPTLIPDTELSYSSIVGVLPRIAERTTTGVDASSDSPFFRSESATTRPLKRRVEVAITVSPFSAFS